MILLLLLLLFHLCCCYSSGVPWTIKARDAWRITAAEMILLFHLCCCYSSGVPSTIKARGARRITAAGMMLLLLLFYLCCCYSSGVPWTIKARDARRITAAHMMLLLLFHLCCCYSSGVLWTIKARNSWRITAAEIILLFHLCCCYSSEVPWTNKARDARRITAAEMKYMRITAGYTWTDHKTNTQIAKELKITEILEKLLEYNRNWIQHVNRMPRNRLPRVIKHYSATGRRNYGGTLKRFLDTWDRNGSTSGPNSVTDIWWWLIWLWPPEAARKDTLWLSRSAFRKTNLTYVLTKKTTLKAQHWVNDRRWNWSV